MDKNRYQEIKDTLDRCHEWPCRYTFKFIVPRKSLSELLERLSELETSTRESKGGKYISVTAEPYLENVDEAVRIYELVDGVPGLMCM